jgi:hypothetical protein
MNTDTQRKRLLEDLERELVRTEQKSKAYEEKQQEANATMRVLKEGISSIFTKIGCTEVSPRSAGLRSTTHVERRRSPARPA